MDKTLSLSLVIGAALGKSYFSTFKSAEQKVGKLGDALKKTGAQQAMLARFGKLKKSVADTAKEMQSAQHKVAALAKEIKATDKPSKTLTNDFNKAKKSASRLKDAHRKQSEALHRLRGDLRGSGVDTRKMIAAQKQLGQAYDVTRRKMERLSKAQKAKSQAAAQLGAMKGKALGVIGAVYGATRIGSRGMSLEMRLETLGVQANKSKQDMIDLHREIMNVSEQDDIKINPDKITAAIEEIVEKTGDLDFAKDNIHNIGLALRATGADGEAIGGIMAELQKMGSFKSPKDVLFAIDTLTAQGKEGAFTLSNLAKLGPRVVTAYSSAVKGARDGAMVVKEMGAALQIIRMGTGSSEQAATAFERLLSELTNNDKLEKLRNLGIDVFDQDALANGEEKLRPITQLMKEIMSATEGKKTLLGDIFGDEAIRAFNAFDEGLINKFMGITADGSTITSDAKRLAKTSSAQWESFSANIKQVGDAFALTLLPALNTVISPISKLMTWVAKGIETFPVIGWAIGGVAAGFVIYATGLGIATAAQWAFNAAMLANPLMRGIAAVVIGATLIYTAWEPVVKWLGGIMDWIGDSWNSIFGDEEKTITQRIKQTTEPIKKPAVAAAMAATMAAVPAHAVSNSSPTEIHNSYQITVPQQPGQDGAKNAEDMMREIERIEASRNRSAMHNRESDL